ncbi:DNA polymerase thumb domain-containing protein [Streptomyces sp. R-07]|uniref:DNA polymerase thumb domain-containing protein n=1 Tax=Streptomyces sp. R-07 TaxID=3404052 RepID=UPI003CEF0D1A
MLVGSRIPGALIPVSIGRSDALALSAGLVAARALGRLGITTIGDVADTPLPTLQRILGAAAGRRAHERARGIDDRPIVPAAAPKSLPAPAP